MEKTPVALRKHVVLIGKRNAGKSTLFNALTGQNKAIVSSQPGTTTDPVRTAMELIPFGPITLIDTAGLDDEGSLGTKRMQKTHDVCRRADAVLYVAAADDFNQAEYLQFCEEKIPHILIFTKSDIFHDNTVHLLADYSDAIFVKNDLTELRERLTAILQSQQQEDETLIGHFLPPGSNVVMVIPVDSEAPKGRLILPQVQLLRDCLDHGIKCFVTRESELTSAMNCLTNVALVVTDSQVFEFVNNHIPRAVPLTSFSILLANQKGNFQQLLEGADQIESLPENARILILEGCTHNHNHEDIGRVKIPFLLQKKTGKHFQFDYFTGYDFPGDLDAYDLVIQCGSCMINKKEITSRLDRIREKKIPVTNYGIVLAWCNGILRRCCECLL